MANGWYVRETPRLRGLESMEHGGVFLLENRIACQSLNGTIFAIALRPKVVCRQYITYDQAEHWKGVDMRGLMGRARGIGGEDPDDAAAPCNALEPEAAVAVRSTESVNTRHSYSSLPHSPNHWTVIRRTTTTTAPCNTTISTSPSVSIPLLRHLPSS